MNIHLVLIVVHYNLIITSSSKCDWNYYLSSQAAVHLPLPETRAPKVRAGGHRHSLMGRFRMCDNQPESIGYEGDRRRLP